MRRAVICLILLLAAPAAAQDAYLLVGNKGGDTLSFIDLETGREVSRRPVSAAAPHEIAVSPDGRQAAVVHYGAESLDIFDVASRDIVRTIDLPEGARPHGIAWLPDNRIVATAEGVDSVVVVDGTSVSTIPTGEQGTHMLAVHPDGRRLYLANMQSASVSLVDLTEGIVVHSVPVGTEPEGVAVIGGEVWVSDRGGDRVFVLDADTLAVLAEIAVGAFPIRIIASPDGRWAVTSNLRDGTVSVIDTATREVTRTLRVSGSEGAQQVTLLFSPDGERLYVAETAMNKIAEIDFASGELLGRLSGGSAGDGLAIVTLPSSP